MEKLTVNRALVELKTLDGRIKKSIDNGLFISGHKKSNQKINGYTIDEHKSHIQGCFDKTRDLIKRRNDIKSAVVKSNANTIVSINGKEMTVAEAIERKDSIDYDRSFLSRMKQQFRNTVAEVNRNNEDIQEKLNTYLQSILGGKDKADPKDVEQYTKMFFEKNEFELIDPLKLESKIQIMEDEIDAFFLEVDSVLSESNAVTHIHI